MKSFIEIKGREKEKGRNKEKERQKDSERGRGRREENRRSFTF